MFLKIGKILLALLLASLPGNQLLACSEYVHLWRPVSEVKSSICNAEGIAIFLRELVSKKLDQFGDKWLIGLNPDSVVTASFTSELKRAVTMLDNSRFGWVTDGSPFVDCSSGSATIWLDFVNPEQMLYIWYDENKPPFAMFRTGELNTASIRVMAMSPKRKILLIDELPYMFLLESDFMLPTWASVGGGWFRRLSFKTAQMPQRHEWTLSIPADMEDVNQTPSDIKRFYFGDIPDQKI
ncbi:MAG: hypothetical protein PHV05_10235, partial [Candidatus Riflebacteria bacterium]|nr:hypothetical protein [Candidatus Riflebacteria bacterium]